MTTRRYVHLYPVLSRRQGSVKWPHNDFAGREVRVTSSSSEELSSLLVDPAVAALVEDLRRQFSRPVSPEASAAFMRAREAQLSWEALSRAVAEGVFARFGYRSNLLPQHHISHNVFAGILETDCVCIDQEADSPLRSVFDPPWPRVLCLIGAQMGCP